MTGDLFYRVMVTAADAEYDLSRDLSSFTIEEQEGLADVLTIELNDPFKLFSHAFQEGMEVEVDLGTVSDHSIVFRGRIHRVNGSFPQDAVPTLTLHAHDHSMRMGLRARNRPWTGALSEIVHEIGEDHGFDRRVVELIGDPAFTGNGVRQQDESDLGFLRRLAEEYACQLYVAADDEGEELRFLAERHIMTQDPELTLAHGRCDVPYRLLSFEPRSDVADVRLPRVFSGIEYGKGRLTGNVRGPADALADTEDVHADENLAEFRARHSERADALDRVISAATRVRADLETELGGVERVVVPTFTTPELLQSRADNQYSTSRLGMRASGASVGNQRIHAQANLGIADVGGRFSGKWYVSQVRHLLNREGYRTEFECRR